MRKVGDSSIENKDSENTIKSDNTGTINTEQKTTQNNKHMMKTIKQEEEPEIVSVNNYDELRSAILNATTNKPLIINLTYQYDPLNPENKGYISTGEIYSINTGLNITINGNNQKMSSDGTADVFLSFEHNVTINDLAITEPVGEIETIFLPPFYFFGNTILNNVTITNNPSGAILLQTGDFDSVLKLVNCTIVNNSNNIYNIDIQLERNRRDIYVNKDYLQQQQ